MSTKRSMRWLERTFLATGLAAAVPFVCLRLPAVLIRARTAQAAPAVADGPVIPATALGSAYLRPSSNASDGVVIGAIEVSSIQLEEPIVEGVSSAALSRGVGHVPGSAQSGGLGNMALAAHRDTAFRPLRSIRKGMDIRVKGADGTFHYVVDTTQVLTPDRVDVLDMSAQPDLTLITCFPFNFIGSAPMRFVVKAHLVSAIPDEQVLQ